MGRVMGRVSATDVAGDVHYDPYDRDLLADPYPAFRRLRDEAPLYYNERYDFYAVTRFADVEQAMLNREDLVTSRGTILEMVKSGIEIPPGTLIMEEGPRHTIHRQLLSRVFTPKAMLGIEPQVHEFCAARLDELAGRDSFDFVVDFAQYVPMRVFGMLLGIPEEEQERVRAHVEAGFQSEAGKPREYTANRMGAEFYEEFVDHRYANPGDDLITRLLTTERWRATTSPVPVRTSSRRSRRKARDPRRDRGSRPQPAVLSTVDSCGRRL